MRIKTLLSQERHLCIFLRDFFLYVTRFRPGVEVYKHVSSYRWEGGVGVEFL